MRVDLGKRKVGELRGLEGAETVVRMYCIREESVSNKNLKIN